MGYDDPNEKKYYCGAGKVPKGYSGYGSVEYCADRRQIRRYGMVKADPEYGKPRKALPDLDYEKIKLKIIENRIIRLRDNVKYYKEILQRHAKGTQKHIWAQKQLDVLNIEEEMKKLKKALDDQKKTIKEAEKKHANKAKK